MGVGFGYTVLVILINFVLISVFKEYPIIQDIIFNGIKAKKSALKKPKFVAIIENKIAVPAKVNATGKPNNKKKNVVANMQMLNI